MANLYSKFIFEQSYFPNKDHPLSYSEGKVHISQYSLIKVKMLFTKLPLFFFFFSPQELLEYRKVKPSN